MLSLHGIYDCFVILNEVKNDKTIADSPIKNYEMKRFILLLALVAWLVAPAQSLREQVLNPVTHSGGSSMSYEYVPQTYTPAPAGFQPFYIDHMGRHGSRNHTTEDFYQNLASKLKQSSEAGQLTPRGEQLLKQMETVAKYMKRRYGDLTQKGAAEHAAIAARMYAAYPGVFAGATRVEAKSTLPTRCVLSMASFCGQLRALNPALQVRMESSEANNYFMNHYSKEYREYYEKGPWREVYDKFKAEMIRPERFMASIFKTVTGKTESQISFMDNVWYAAIILQDLDIEMDIYDLFTDDEKYALWQVHNLNQYLRKGPSALGGELALSIAKPMLRDMLKTAEAAIRKGEYAANLRFGHGECLMPLAGLMGIEGASTAEADPHKVYLAWQDFRVTPMGGNIQWIFYRNAAGEVILKVLHNEREASIPVKRFSGPYYKWKDVQAYYTKIAAE